MRTHADLQPYGGDSLLDNCAMRVQFTQGCIDLNE